MSWHDTNNGSSSVSAVCVSVGASFCVRGSSMPKLARPAMATSIEMAVRIQSYNQRNLSKWIQKPAWLSHFGRFPPTTKNSLKVFRVFYTELPLMVELVCGPYSLGQWVKSLVAHGCCLPGSRLQTHRKRLHKLFFFGNQTEDWRWKHTIKQ